MSKQAGSMVDDNLSSIDAPKAAHAVRPVAGIKALAGCGFGQRQPVLIAPVRVACPPALDIAALDATLASLVGREASPLPAIGDRDDALAAVVLRLAVGLQAEAGHPVFDPGAVVRSSGTHSLAVPYDDVRSGRHAVQWAVRVVAQLAATQAGDGAEKDVPAAIRQEVVAFLDSIRRLRSSHAGNTLHMLAAASAMGVPWLHLGGYVYQIGQGARSRWFSSTMTDATTRLGSTLAQNKMTTARLLRDAGLPAPVHAVARSEDDAAAIATRLGYPVVVKPVDLDGGKGVAAGLRDEASLRQAFQSAARFRTPILVEKHVDGDDFRLVVVGDQVTWAIQRQPGGVTGDGIASIAGLLHALNADPRRGTAPGTLLKRIEWDDEAAALVAEQGLHADAVPAAGRFVRLRRVANIVGGGMPVPALDRVHPDNLRMAVRAAQIFRLDLAGIDYITPDITRPWHAVGGIINEVNVQPNFGFVTAGHLFGDVVRWMLDGGDGRIPIAAVTGGDDTMRADVVDRLHAILRADGRQAAAASARGAWIGDEQVSWADMSGFAGGRLLLAERRAEAAVLEMPAARIYTTGLPFDVCDVAALIGRGGRTEPEEELAARARHGVVLPVGETCRSIRDPRKLTMVSIDGPDSRIAAHLDAGGRAVWRDGGGPGMTLSIATAPPPGATGGSAVTRLTLPAAATESSLHAVAIAIAMGCGIEPIRRATT